MQEIKKAEAEKGTGDKERLPISPKLLRKIKAAWDPHATNRDIKMLCATTAASKGIEDSIIKTIGR